MRIFSAVRHSLDPAKFHGGLWSGNFHPALRSLGHEVVESQVDLAPASEFMDVALPFSAEQREMRARKTESILNEVETHSRRGGFDLFLGYFYNSHFEPSGFDKLRRMSIPSVNFFCNSMYQFQLVESIAAKVDYSWHPEKDATAVYRKAGGNPIHVQMGAAPEVYHPVPGTIAAADACFIGQRYADRDQWLGALARAGVPLSIYGEGWGAPSAPTASSPPTPPEKAPARRGARPGSLVSYAKRAASILQSYGAIQGVKRLTTSALLRRQTARNLRSLIPLARGRAASVKETLAAHAVCLNFSNVWADGMPGSALIPHVRLRDFEGPMCRTCYLTGHTEEIAEFYELGREIDTYRTEEELVDKTRYYLARPEAAERLREAGWQRARRDHTWERRFTELFSKLGL